MGIIPLGSGNGLARHLGIPMDFKMACEKALTGHLIEIDVLTWNNQPFFVRQASDLMQKLPKISPTSKVEV